MGYGIQAKRRELVCRMNVKPKSAEVVDLIEKLDREDLERLVRSLLSNGVALSFHGKRTAMVIARRVPDEAANDLRKISFSPSRSVFPWPSSGEER
jgi:hypothetical protein